MKKIKQYIRDFHLKENFEIKSRELKIPVNTQKIITLIGVRRCGKTSILYEVINELTNEIPREKVLFFNFEDERLNFNIDSLDLILQAYLELYPDINIKNSYLFFDEIQNVDGWETFIRRVYDNVCKNIFITGSNSKLLSKEIATNLRGRTIVYEVYPLSFKEYLFFKEVEIDLYSTKSLAFIKYNLEKFLLEGGFPEVVLLDDKFSQKILQDYFNVLIYRDLVERFKISNSIALKFFLKRVLASSTKQISINKIYNDLKSSGIKIGKNSLYEFLSYIQDVYFSLILNKYDKKVSSQSDKKIYSIDVGFNNAVSYKFSDDIGKSMENAVFLELKRLDLEMFYYQDRNSECDFIINDRGKIKKAIQVSYDMENEDTRKRELKGLINACKKFGLTQGFIISYSEETTYVLDGIKINIIPLHDFLLLSKDFLENS
ncbi:MAG: ATPase [Candidatus Cloacimonadota bacterium]|nr:MAG: ATPase [Candidatus Cloacimonadota bacterium]